MKKILNLLPAIFISIAALATGGMNFEQNMTWAEVRAKAAKEKKMIFFDAYTTWCGPCKYLDESVYSDPSVAVYYNSNYINVKFDMEAGEGLALAEEFNITSYPTLLFFSSEGVLVHKYIGAMKAPDFIKLGEEARDPSMQYFTLKQKVVDQKATVEEFIKWTEIAEELEDGNRGEVASDWLSSQEDILATAELARATLLYSDVTEEQLEYLYQNRDKIAALMGWDQDKVSTTLYRKMFKLALVNSESNNRGPDEFGGTIRKFDAAMLQYAITDRNMLKAVYEEQDADKGMNILIRSLEEKDRLNLQEFCNLLIDYSPRFENKQVALLAEILSTYSIQESDKGKECWLYLALVICYSKSGDFVKAKESAEKAYHHPNIPQQYKQILEESFGIGD